jgi:hypothetical protein
MAFLGINTQDDNVFTSLETTADIPLTDQAAWDLYPKHRWVYCTSRLLDLQNIEWSLFYNETFCASLEELGGARNFTEQEMWTDVLKDGDPMPGTIFIKPLSGDSLTTDVVVLKGELKWLAHHTHSVSERKSHLVVGKKVLPEVRGELDLRIAALTRMHFQKFTGVISVDTIGNVIVGVRLRMTPDVISQYPKDWMKHVVKLYNRKQWAAIK